MPIRRTKIRPAILVSLLIWPPLGAQAVVSGVEALTDDESLSS